MPARIQIGPFGFMVTTDAAALAEARRNGNDGRLGETDTLRLTMAIDDTLPGDQVRDTLLHETLHAMVYALGGWPKEVEEERMVRSLATLLLDTLRRNPGLVAHLMSED